MPYDKCGCIHGRTGLCDPGRCKKVFTDVTAHRMILDSRARYQEQSAKDILEEILKDTPAPKVEG